MIFSSSSTWDSPDADALGRMIVKRIDLNHNPLFVPLTRATYHCHIVECLKNRNNDKAGFMVVICV